MPPSYTDVYCEHSNLDSILFYDVYYPSPSVYDYKQCKLPALIFVHGGGFSDCSPIGPNSDICTAFAQRGFVVYNVSYRIGRQYLSPAITTAQQELATYRASQDLRGAIRTIIQRQMKQSSLLASQREEYQMNTDYVFLGGTSAGSVTVLNAAYYPTQAMVNAVSPHAAGGITLETALGSIDADYYDCDSSIPYVDNLVGILNMWGSVSLQPSYYTNGNESDFFINNKKIPVISFHGRQDPVINIGAAPIKFAISTNTAQAPFNSETACLANGPFQNENNNNIDLYAYGSHAFFDRILTPLQIPSELYIDCTMKHGLDCYPYNAQNCTAPFMSDFGTGYTNPTDVNLYIVGRAATFFQAIIKGIAQARYDDSTKHRIFIECRNNRVKCDMPNSDDNCTDADNPCP